MSNIPGDTRGSGRTRSRSKAWVYYAILAVGGLFGFISAPSFSLFIGVVLVAAYSAYIYRGGRFVFWIW